MNPQPTPTQPTPLPLDPATLATLLQTTLDTLPHHPAATPAEIASLRQAAVQSITNLHPRDPIEAILAARIVATHFAAMDCLRCAAQPGLPLALKLRCRGKFASLSRLMDATSTALTARQARPSRQAAIVPAPIPAPRPQPAPAAAAPAAPAKPNRRSVAPVCWCSSPASPSRPASRRIP